jgi:hypothetical protein
MLVATTSRDQVQRDLACAAAISQLPVELRSYLGTRPPSSIEELVLRVRTTMNLFNEVISLYALSAAYWREQTVVT